MDDKIENTQIPNRPDTVSCVIRVHDPSKIDDLALALMGLAGQTYSFVEPIIVLQEFSLDEEQSIQSLCSEVPWPDTFLPAKIINLESLGDGDHRAIAATSGIKARSGRYLCFLDYDDQIYSECYSTLHRRLESSGKAVAVVGTVACNVEPTIFGNFVHGKNRIFEDRSKYDFFIENQYPIHSYMLDTSKIDNRLLEFDAGRTKNEDYAFLMRILAVNDWDIAALNKPLAEYHMRIDGSNTIMAHSAYDAAKWESWREAIRYIDNLRDELDVTLPCNELVALLHGAKDVSIENVKVSSEFEKLNAVLGKLIYKLKLKDIKKTPYGNLDEVQLLNSGKIRVRGWIASPNKSPLDVILVADQKSKKSLPSSILTGMCGDVRDDVRIHLNTERNSYGFDFESDSVTKMPEMPLLVGLTLDGQIFQLWHKTKNNFVSRVKAYLTSKL